MITCEELLAYGESIVESDREVVIRSSAGRSYYAGYHRANGWHEALPSQGVADGGMGAHATLIQCLQKPTVTGPRAMTSRSIGYILAMIKAHRNTADYQLQASFDQATAKTVAANAQIILQKAV